MRRLSSIRSVLFLAAAVGGLVPGMAATPAAAQGVYAAVAISSSTGAFGYGFNYATADEARTRALAECRKFATDCRVYSEFQRNCIAVARSTNNAFGWTLGYTAEERPERALNECAARNGINCKIIAAFCSGAENR